MLQNDILHTTSTPPRYLFAVHIQIIFLIEMYMNLMSYLDALLFRDVLFVFHIHPSCLTPLIGYLQLSTTNVPLITQ